MTVKILHVHTCDICGEQHIQEATYQQPPIPYPVGWHLLDSKHICPKHEVIIKEGV